MIWSQVSDPHPPLGKKLLAFGGLVVVISVPIVLLLFLRSEIVQTPLPIGKPVPLLELALLNDQTLMVLAEN